MTESHLFLEGIAKFNRAMELIRQREMGKIKFEYTKFAQVPLAHNPLVQSVRYQMIQQMEIEAGMLRKTFFPKDIQNRIARYLDREIKIVSADATITLGKK